MNEEKVILVENIGKRYVIGKRQKYLTLIETIISIIKVPYLWLKEDNVTNKTYFWALKDVSFSVNKGEVIGIIGRNGAGKSTLLKLLSRITHLTEGKIILRGRVSSLLEVGTGFHPELTGRENIYLNGSILGMSSSEINQKFEEIVEFAEIGKFLDTPVKRYSSGMYVRLAFAVAAHLEPEIFLVDEVLAVGDIEFQKKCLGKMGSVAKEGRTVFFVSHNTGAIAKLCNRVLWIDDGKLRLSGNPNEVISAYLTSGEEGSSSWKSTSIPTVDQEVQITSTRLLSMDDVTLDVFDFDKSFRIELGYKIIEKIRNLSVTYQVLDSQGNFVFESIDEDTTNLKGSSREPGRYLAKCTIPSQLLKPGRYYVNVVAFVQDIKMIDRHDVVITFDISEIGYSLSPRYGIIAPVLEWVVNKV